MTNTDTTNEIRLPWVRLTGPEKVSLDQAGGGDDMVGDYAWQSVYGCGTLRAEVSHYLALNDMNGEEWSDISPAGVDQLTCIWSIAGVDEWGCEVTNEDHDYVYEGRSFFSYTNPDEAEKAHAELDRHGRENLAGYFTPRTFDEAQGGAEANAYGIDQTTPMQARLSSHLARDAAA